jgi:hypothetical protein
MAKCLRRRLAMTLSSVEFGFTQQRVCVDVDESIMSRMRSGSDEEEEEFLIRESRD